MNSNRFSLGNLRSPAAHSEQNDQRAGVRMVSEDELSSLATPRKYTSHASGHDWFAAMIQNDTTSVQATYHLCQKNIAHKQKELTCIRLQCSLDAR